MREVTLPLNSGETPLAVLYLDLGSPAQKGHEAVQVGPDEGQKNDQGGEALLL